MTFAINLVCQEMMISEAVTLSSIAAAFPRQNYSCQFRVEKFLKIWGSSSGKFGKGGIVP